MQQEFVTLPREVVEQAVEALFCTDSEEGSTAYKNELKAVKKLRAALDQPQDHVPDARNMVPAGWKLVPVEPTDDMLYDIQEFSHILPPRGKRIWAHMLAAAPQPPVVEQPQVEQEPVAWAEEIIEYLHAHYDTEMIKELDSGDALIRLDDAIAAVEEVEQRYTYLQPKREPLTDEEIDKLCPQFDDPMRREMWIIGFKAAHNIK